MITRIKKIYFPVAWFAIVSLLIVSCNKEDNTGYSTLTPTAPTIAIAGGFTSPATLVENDSVFEYTVTLSEAQLVDIKLNVKQVGGTASTDDYEMNTDIYFPAGSTVATGKITIKSDELVEETEILTVQIGDNETANSTITPVTFEFNIQNLTSTDLNIQLSWNAELYDVDGSLIPPAALADMRLLIVDADGNILDGADGSSFESYVMVDEDWPNDEYFIAADFYAAANLGDQGTFSLDITLGYLQPGVQANGFLFPGLMNTEVTCDAYRAILAKLTKDGSTYTLEPVGTAEVAYDVNDYTGEYTCDEPGYGTFLTNFTAGTEENTIVEDNFWDSGLEVVYVLNPEDQTVVIAEGTTFVADLGRGDETWVIEGEGTFNVCDFSMVVDYVVYAEADGVEVDANTHTFTKN